MKEEDFERDDGGLVYGIVSGLSVALVLILALAAYTYKYRGTSRYSEFRNWTLNCCRSCSQFKCNCFEAQGEHHDGLAVQFRGQSHNNEADGFDNLATVSEVIRHEENHLRTSVARVLGITNYESSPMNLDRQHLRFTAELGKGWFGYVLRGTLMNMSNTFEPNYNYEELKTPVSDNAARREPDVVVVQQLREEAKVSERNLFFEEARASALVGSTSPAERHPNILTMVGFCLDKPPYLMVYEFCSHGDLKTFLRVNRDKVHQLEKDNMILRFCRDISCGLSHLHRTNCIPNDLAARTCQVDHFYNVKIGDYGISRSIYPGDYLSCNLSTTMGFTSSAMSFAHRTSYLPLRWMAPEVLAELHQSRNAVDSLWMRNSPPESMWTLGITLWEVCSMGEIPFARIFDHQFFLTMSNGPVIGDDRAMGKGQLPGRTYVQGDSAEAIHDVIDLCLKLNPDERANCQRIENYFRDLYQCQTALQDRDSVREELI